MEGNTYRIRKALPEDVDIIFSMIKERIHWMDEKNLDSWNRNGYLDKYGIEYFRNHLENLWVAEESGKAVAAMVVFTLDDRWPDQKKAVYVHNFVSALHHSGAGNALLSYADQIAREWGMDRVRLDSARHNKKLEDYYKSRGFESRGTCSSGLYDGILREKLL